MMKSSIFYITIILLIMVAFSAVAGGQTITREFAVVGDHLIVIKNLHGRVSVSAEEMDDQKIYLTAENALADEVSSLFDRQQRFLVSVKPLDSGKRIDLSLKLPPRMRVKIETLSGEVKIEGDLHTAEVKTETGTIAAFVPLEDLKYNFVWLTSRPRLLSDVKLEEVREKAAGRFVVRGHYVRSAEEKDKYADYILDKPAAGSGAESAPDEDVGEKTVAGIKDVSIKLDLTTGRGIILLNVTPEAVPSDLRERPLTKAAKTIVRSGDSLLINAIRRASPKYFSEYAATLPGYQRPPTLTARESAPEQIDAPVKRVLVKVTDFNNRAIHDLNKDDFVLTEHGREREVLSVEPTTAPFNLVLLLDVSGSVDNYVDFIRKAARSFVDTVNPNDQIAIIIFNEDVDVLSGFTTDKIKLSESLDTFDAGGGTAFYDALGYVLAETLRPLRGERTAIVVLSDGDDTRSFLPFEALLGSIQESGALIYPLYVPSELIAASARTDPNKSIDPLRTRYMGLTSKAETEGEKLARISGGIYYPIKQTTEIQAAYDDIIRQLRTAYSITYRSEVESGSRPAGTVSRLKVRVKRENAFVRLGSVVAVDSEKFSSHQPRD